MVRQGSEQVSNPKGDPRSKGQRSWIIPIAEISKQRHRQVHRQLRRRTHGIDLELAVSQVFQEQRSVQGVRGDAPRAQAAEYRAGKACVFEHMASHLSTITLDNAVDDVAKEGLIVAEEVARGARGME